MTVGIMALVPQAGRKAISRRIKEALAVAKARGLKLGNPNGAEALRRAGKVGVALRTAVVGNADQLAADLAQVVADIRAGGATSLREVAPALTARGHAYAEGWTVAGVECAEFDSEALPNSMTYGLGGTV